MKYTSLFKLALFGFVIAFLASSCVKEGPMGPAGADGEDGLDGSDGRDGVDGNVTCLVCHSGTNMEQIQGEFVMSAHNVGAIAVDYAGGRARCAPCHSHEQFVQTFTIGSVQGDITNPSAWKCNTCHGIHKTFEGTDYALRTTDPVKPLFNDALTMDLGGNSNLCATCHQSRRAGPSVTNPGEETFTISSSHWGPHHGPQSNVVMGMGFEEIAGSIAYPDPGTAPHATQASCTGCHMGEFADGQGGHSYIPSVAACNDCHSGADLDDSYNYKGAQTLIAEKLDELRDKLLALHVLHGNEEEGYHPVNSRDFTEEEATFPTVHAQAFFNWIGLAEDRSLGAHNPEYVKAVLLNTLEALENESH